MAKPAAKQVAKEVALPELLYDTERWTLLCLDAVALRVFKRKIRRKIVGPAFVDNDFHI